jgi:hypothetical protein
MKLLIKRRGAWVLCLLAGVNLMSCKPSHHSKADSESNRPAAARETEAREEVLSKEQIIELTNHAIRERGFDLGRHRTYYDEGNRFWDHYFSRSSPELQGLDYQAVMYYVEPSEAMFWDPVWVVIDKKTGVVLKTALGFGIGR